MSIDEFKNHDAFQNILGEFVTLDSIRLAIGRAEKIVIAPDNACIGRNPIL